MKVKRSKVGERRKKRVGGKKRSRCRCLRKSRYGEGEVGGRERKERRKGREDQ